MVGLIIAALICAYHNLTGGVTDLGQLLLIGTNFLYWWYMIWGIVVCSIMAIIALLTFFGLSIGGAAAGAKAGVGGLILGGLAGVGAGGLIALLLIVGACIRYAAFIVGAYMLHASYIVVDGTWDTTKLVIGGVLLFVGLIMSRGKSSSSSSSSSD